MGADKIGIFGAGHLGRTIAQSLIRNGTPRSNVLLAHRDSPETRKAIANDGLADLVTSPEMLAAQAKVIFYTVRPQDYRAIGEFTLLPEAVFISVLAGVALRQIPIQPLTVQRVRIMTSAPATFSKGLAIAGIFPSDHAVLRRLMAQIGVRVIGLKQENDIHIFTAVGPCLPMALMYYESLGKPVDTKQLSHLTTALDLEKDFDLIAWAYRAQARGLSQDERQRYFAQAATPGGITEAIFKAIDGGADLPAAIAQGIRRSEQLAVG